MLIYLSYIVRKRYIHCSVLLELWIRSPHQSVVPNFRYLSCLVYAKHSPLAAAEAPSFLLIEKKQKIKTEKSFPPQAFTFWPAFLSGHRSFITRPKILVNLINPLNPGSKFPMLLPRSRPPLFCPLSPEAVCRRGQKSCRRREVSRLYGI
jgi:hypothetical protein